MLHVRAATPHFASVVSLAQPMPPDMQMGGRGKNKSTWSRGTSRCCEIYGVCLVREDAVLEAEL